MEYLTPKQMKEVDDISIQFGISIDQMMENAGRNLANFVSKLKPKRVWVLYGKGNNGGGGLVAARHLKIKGYEVGVIGVADFNENNETVQNRLRVLDNQNISNSNIDSVKIQEEDIIIDTLLGYNAKGDPRKGFDDVINKVNQVKDKIKVVSLDIPSGIDPETGEKYDPHIEADHILTLALPKIGLKNFDNVYLVNIGIPNQVYEKLGIKVDHYFKDKDIIKL